MDTHQAYRPISDYAVIGNTHSAALIGRDGSIDWCCLPHFDSPAVFCRLLDARQGGYFKVGSAGAHRVSRRYAAHGAALETEFSTAGGAIRVTDFMHSERLVSCRLGIDKAHCHRVLRCVDGLDGEVELEVAFRPSFESTKLLRIKPSGAIASVVRKLTSRRANPQEMDFDFLRLFVARVGRGGMHEGCTGRCRSADERLRLGSFRGHRFKRLSLRSQERRLSLPLIARGCWTTKQERLPDPRRLAREDT